MLPDISACLQTDESIPVGETIGSGAAIETVMRIYIQSDTENCEGWLSPGGYRSGGRGGRALTA